MFEIVAHWDFRELSRIWSKGLTCSSFISINDMPQAENSNLSLYADDSCLMFQHKDGEEIEKVLNNDFENVCDWFCWQ